MMLLFEYELRYSIRTLSQKERIVWPNKILSSCDALLLVGRFVSTDIQIVCIASRMFAAQICRISKLSEVLYQELCHFCRLAFICSSSFTLPYHSVEMCWQILPLQEQVNIYNRGYAEQTQHSTLYPGLLVADGK